MKNPRDIMLVGTGFLLGTIFCYFLIAARLVEPKRGDMTVIFSSTRQATNAPAAREINLFPKKADGVRIDRTDQAVKFETPFRYVPVRRVRNLVRFSGPGVMVESTVLHYDLIDLKYVPDFTLSAD